MFYDAVAVSPEDMRAGEGFFRTSLAAGFPWISANVFDEHEQPVFAPSVVIKNEGLPDVGIIGLTGKSDTAPSWARIADWREILPKQISRLESISGLLILLSNLSDAEHQEIAENYPQIDIIIASSPTRYGNQAPLFVGNSLITQSDGRGKHLGKLDLKWHQNGSWLANSPTESHKHLQDRLSVADSQIQKFREGTNETHPEYKRKLTELLNYRKSIEDQLTSLELVIAEQEPVPANTFDSTFLPVKPLASGDDVDTIVQDIKKSIAAYQKVRLKQDEQIQQKAGEALQVSQYAGFDTCRSCHEKQSAFWASTSHAKAFTTLVEAGQNYNPECLPCHVTGGSISPVSSYSQKGLLLVLPENRQSVGCETCHGPGKQHSLDPEKSGSIRKKPIEKSCVACHTPEHDDDFDYTIKMNMAACPTGT